jgi:hypothetical protein
MRPSRSGGKVIFVDQTVARPVLADNGDGSFKLTNFSGSQHFYLYESGTGAAPWFGIDDQTGPSPLIFPGDVTSGYFYASLNPTGIGPSPFDSNELFIP